MQTPSQLWFTLFKLDGLLMNLRKLFENVSTSKFLRGICIEHCLISRVKIMNNVLRWLKTVSITFQDAAFDGSLLPLIIS